MQCKLGACSITIKQEQNSPHSEGTIRKEQQRKMDSTPGAAERNNTSTDEAHQTTIDETAAGPHQLDPDLMDIIPMRYKNFRVKISKQLGTPCRYYYEPVVLLNPQKIQSQINKANGQAYVRFPIQMWDEQIEEQVINWLKRLPGSQDVEDFSIQMMPYDEVRLVTRRDDSTSIGYHLPKYPTPYQHLDQSLQFHLLCDSKEAADILAESFKSDPAFMLQDFALECTRASVASHHLSNEGQRKRSRLESGTKVSPESVRIFRYMKFNIDSPIGVGTAVDSNRATQGD